MLLVIETATAALSVALFDGERVVAAHHEIVGRGHAERLLPVIADMLGANVLGQRRPTAIAVDCGPGSFTGVRVGLAAAQGLRIAWQVPVSGFSSLSLVAAQVDENGSVAVALSGGHGEVFAQMFETSPLRPTDTMRSLAPADAAKALVAARIFGSGAAAVVAARGWGEAVDTLPRASDFNKLPDALAALPLRPIYGRAPDAKPSMRTP